MKRQPTFLTVDVDDVGIARVAMFGDVQPVGRAVQAEELYVNYKLASSPDEINEELVEEVEGTTVDEWFIEKVERIPGKYRAYRVYLIDENIGEYIWEV